ncbi:MAG: NifU family protein [Flammeovirgaceae bacterium]|nr:NifU family protein [Flammeovirgaceae bacterium]MDW8286575.1 NifU family protein [Flammeovirgaceae bacterium]
MAETTYNRQMLYNTLVHIYTESNPNPHSMKFMLNFMLMAEGVSLDFPDVASTYQKSPLAQALFEAFPFVKRVFMANNFITITKTEEKEWIEIISQLKSFIKEYIEAKKPIFAESLPDQQVVVEQDNEVVKKIKLVLEEYIRPAVETDGGAIQFVSFDQEKGMLTVQLQGSCSGCPSSTVTLKAGIENLMKRMVPQVKEVVSEAI